MVLQQKSDQMVNNLAEQQVNNNKAKNKMTNIGTTLFTTIQVIKTYDFGNFGNCELNIGIILIYLHLHPLMYHMCKNLHRRASFFL